MTDFYRKKDITRNWITYYPFFSS